MTRDSPARRHRLRGHRVTAALAAAALLCAGATAATSQDTDAAFTDQESVSASFTSATLATPAVTSCTVSTLLDLGIVFLGFTIVWTSPYPTEGVQLRINDVPMTTGITRTGSGPYTYTGTFSLSLLQTVLAGLLGSTNTVTVRGVSGTNWVSPPVTRTLRIGGVLGITGPNNCT